ncbi:O-antigen polymerase [uncultured Chryseobacterium sp.]|uniref:O-antigen polymerase n=1 Tax=uncultured Chryseobacterium sp. TaxID=259322 RepID=UPI0025FAC641|nr:O-antigen polymerase [uncultured Chryseobacterium sp.]
MKYRIKFDKACLVIQLVIYLFLVLYKSDVMLLLNFLFSFIISVKLCKDNSKENFLLSNFFVLFSLIFFLYGISASLVQFVFFGHIFSDYYNATILYAACFPALLIGMSKKKFINTRKYYFDNLKNIKIKPRIFFIVLTLLLIYKVISFYKQGTLFNFSAYTSNRLELLKDTSQLDVVVGLLLTGSYLYLIYYFPKLSFKNKFLLCGLTIFYIFIQISAGNRRDFVPIILGFMWVIANVKKIKFNIIMLSLFIIGIIFFNILAVFRTQSEETFDRSAVIENSFKYNEFVFPFETLKYEVNDYIDDKTTLRYGSTILINSTTIFVPREIFPQKPNSLAYDFVMDRFSGGIGYAYLPITEFFINFGFVGCIICFYFLGNFFLFYYNSINQRVIFLCYALIFDFCRGEISGLIYNFVFTSLFLVIIPIFYKGLIRSK